MKELKLWKEDCSIFLSHTSRLDMKDKKIYVCDIDSNWKEYIKYKISCFINNYVSKYCIPENPLWPLYNMFSHAIDNRKNACNKWDLLKDFSISIIIWKNWELLEYCVDC
jgi:hypothetical protein